MPEVVLRFEPDNVLTFDKSSNEGPVQTTLKLFNDSDSLDVLFRVQTTSPATYRVRPSHGRIPASGHAEVQVVMVMDPVKPDKFLIKYVTVAHSLPSGDFMGQFSEAEATMEERKLRVAVVGKEPIPEPETKGESEAPKLSESPLKSTISDVPTDLMTELKEARNKIQSLMTRNQELTKALEETNNTGNIEHPETKLPQGISETELNSLIEAQNGFPPVLVILIALFAFLIGLLF